MSRIQINTEALKDVLAASVAGTMSFPTVVGALLAQGVESYRIDYLRMEATYYFPDGQSHVEPVPLPPHPVAELFSAPGVQAAIREAQAGTVKYPVFSRMAVESGTANYVAYLTGRKVIYFGRNGDLHIEHFPAPVA